MRYSGMVLRSSICTSKESWRILAHSLFWVPTIFLSILLSHNAILYFTHGGDYGILPEKLHAREDWLWNACFYIHLPAGIICLLVPILSFTRSYLTIGLPFHRLIGKLYIFITCWIVCPTGVYLALYAKGGLVTQTGFVLQAILLLCFTYLGFRAIQGKDVSKHIEFMIRSYAIALVVITFRILHILFFVFKIPYQDNYAISQWLGLFLNWWIAETVIAVIKKKKNKTIHTQTIQI